MSRRLCLCCTPPPGAASETVTAFLVSSLALRPATTSQERTRHTAQSGRHIRPWTCPRRRAHRPRRRRLRRRQASMWSLTRGTTKSGGDCSSMPPSTATSTSLPGWRWSCCRRRLAPRARTPPASGRRAAGRCTWPRPTAGRTSAATLSRTSASPSTSSPTNARRRCSWRPRSATPRRRPGSWSAAPARAPRTTTARPRSTGPLTTVRTHAPRRPTPPRSAPCSCCSRRERQRRGHSAVAMAMPCRAGTGARPRLTYWRVVRAAGDRDLAMLLLYKGADVGAANPRGTALHVAAMRGCPEVVRVLLRHGADPNKFASRVFTPLVSSLLGGSVECMKLLIEAGANVLAGGFSGATPLLLACSRRGNIGFVKCLLKAGADPNVPDELGRLPIEIAAVQAEKKLVHLLFPVTRCPPNMFGWSVAGIMSYVNSAAYKERVRKDSCKRKAELKLEGNKAYTIKDYDTAILMYNLALKFEDANDIDASIYSNRSLCWLRLGVGDEALSDAQACIRSWPDWGKGYYREGEAFRFLQDYASAFASFLKASELDPQNPKIAGALRDLSERAKGASGSPC